MITLNDEDYYNRKKMNQEEEWDDEDIDLSGLDLDGILSEAERNTLEKNMSFDINNTPVWSDGGIDLELNEQETADMIAGERSEYSHPAEFRSTPHERAVLILDKTDDRKAFEIFSETRESLEKEGDREPHMALLDRDNYVRGEVPLHIYMGRVGVDRLTDLIDAGTLSVTYSGLPEASYRRLEDGMERGRNAYAGTINGEAEYSINRDMSLTVSNFLKSDNVHVFEEAYSAEIEATNLEEAEEISDRLSVKGTEPDMGDYAGDYRGWNDPDYEPEDDMEREMGDEYF